MRSITLINSLGCALGLIATSTSFAGTNLIYAGSQGGGSFWDQAIWQTNNGTGVGAGTAVGPTVAGNTYTTRSNATAFGNNTGSGRIRNTLTSAGNVITFNGDSLTLTTNTEIRAKNITTPSAITGPVLNFPGVGGNPGLILSGGILNAGDDGVFKIDGNIQVANQSYLCPGDNGGGGTLRPNRGFTIQGQLSGSGTMVLFQGTDTTPHTISGAGNTFSGQWIIKAGRLVGTAANSLGTNSITCDPNWGLPVPPFSSATPVVDIAGPAIFEPGYTLNSAGVLILTNGGRMRLHQEVCFTAVYIHDPILSINTSLTPGIHYFPELAANYPNNFDAGGSGAVVVQPYGTPPPLPPSITTQPLSQRAYAGATTRFAVRAVDNGFPPLTYQWRRNGTNLPNGGNISGATTNTLVVSTVSAVDAAAGYDVVVANASFPVTSSVVSLTLVNTNGEPYEGAVLAAGPVAFYQLNETVDPTTGTAEAFDYVNGYVGTYGVGALNGFSGILGPLTADGFPGFGAGNTAAQSTLNGTFGVSRVNVLPWNLNSSTVTLMAWINPSGGQAANEGLVFCRGGATVAGLCYNSSGQLGYNWNNEADTYNWNSGLTPPSGQWSLVALVVTPTNATVYLLNSSGLAAASHLYDHVVQRFDGTTLIGDDSFDGGNNSRSFSGNIDNVAVFNRALSSSDLMTLYSTASGIATFAPAIAVPPVSTTLYRGQTLSFSGLAVGTGPLTYQWQAGSVGSGVYANLNDDSRISGSTTPNLTIKNIDFPDGLDYVVVVTNLVGPVTSSPPATLTVNATSAAENIVLTNQQAGGLDWDTANSVTSWLDGLGASTSAAAKPGSTYEVLAGARLRSPQNPVVANFPGQLLTLDGDGVWNVNPAAPPAVVTISEIRFKQPTDGIVNGTVNFPRLVMNGGQLDAGNDGLLIVGGRIDVLTNAPFNNDSANDRGYRIDAQLNGPGTIEYHGYNQAFTAAYSNNLNIACSSNTFSGSWNIVTGLLLGTATNCLGTNNIIVGTNGSIQTSYPIRDTNGNLVLFGKFFLTQSNLFRSVLINGLSLAPGTYSFATLNSTYSNNFPATWITHNGAPGVTAGAGAITVLSNAGPIITTHPQSVTLYGQQNAQFKVTAIGNLPLSYQWMAGAIGSGIYTNLADAGNIAGSTNATLNITNITAANGADYLVSVTNIYGAVTSRVATLTVRPGPAITLQPLSQSLYMGQTAQFFVSTLGNLPLVNRWQSSPTGLGTYTDITDGGQFSGATTTNLNISALGSQNERDYIFIVSNAGGSVTSAVATLTIQQTNAAEHITLDFGGIPIQQAQGADWNTANQWSDGLAASVSAPFKPGSTYEVVTGARLRSPAAAASSIFPGLVLTNSGSGIFVNNNDATLGEIRFKHASPGTVFFKKLVMNGGELDSGDNGTLIIQGELNILANTPIYADNAAGNDRPYQIDAWLTGNGSIEYHDFDASFNSVGGLNITGTSNTFSGTWNIVQGALLGSALNCLGTNTIMIGTNGALETLYDINNPNGALTLDGKLFLHQNDTFRRVTIGGIGVPAGTYPYTQLTSMFPANFPLSWPPQQTSTFTTISGSITILESPPGYVRVQVSGPNLQISWTPPGILLEATNLVGPWITNNATSPYIFAPADPQKFFKVQVTQ